MTANNILYVEDNPDNMRLVERALKAKGYTIHGAITGLSGLQMAESIMPTVILLDINLPDIDGYEVARRIRKHRNSDLRQVPIIAITANTLKGDAEKALDAGCDVYMSKPINIRELWARVEAFMPGEDFLA
ncbi:MAG: response regulator [Anaerolineae bacterium]|jgi:two-component system cell cycle response regulator DivK|nr:response regulator [Anaerolineae bacterium]MBT3713814.1 response regulator [Anaerolineae bacterium]MBT4310028.1 response regulator [Anaerolineae bacterium]MBT4457438.1 response regulator [Anaerolineae bacterium]MBT4843046.1 response regulator [Anaerolineae bacterium]